MTRQPVYVTGMGCLCAPGTSVPAAMASLYRGLRRAQKPQNFTTTLDQGYPAFEILEPVGQNDEMVTRTTQLTLVALQEALRQAKLDLSFLQKKRVGIAIGTSVGCTLNNEPYYRQYKQGLFPDHQAIDIYLHNNPALYISRTFGLTGPAATVANACSSGTDAIGLAKSWLDNDQCDLVIAGGADELSRITYLGFISLLVTSTELCRPFDRDRKGLNLGEGAGILIMEHSSSAGERGASILASVNGFGTFADAYHPTAPHPEGTGLRRAIDQALKQAGLTASQIGFINAHGTSTQNNDEVEGKVIADLFGTDIPVVSTKSYTGHTLGAAGAIEAVFTIRGLTDQKIPATPGFETPDPQCMVTPAKQNLKVQAEFALSNSLAFGGNNSALILGRVS